MKNFPQDEVKFLTKSITFGAYISLFMTTVVSGAIIISNVSEKFKLYYYGFYTIYNFVFCLLLLIRIPFYKRERRESMNNLVDENIRSKQ